MVEWQQLTADFGIFDKNGSRNTQEADSSWNLPGSAADCARLEFLDDQDSNHLTNKFSPSDFGEKSSISLILWESLEATKHFVFCVVADFFLQKKVSVAMMGAV